MDTYSSDAGTAEKVTQAALCALPGWLWVPKTSASWPNAQLMWLLGTPSARSWDDPQLVGLKLIFLIATRAVSLLGLSRREEWQKDAEILLLRHQLAVALRERPGLARV